MLDFAKIRIQAGNGGRGSVSFRREKFVPKGGPDGGDGGDGGDFYIIASNDVSTLLDFQFLDHFEAPSGEPGDVGLKAGKDGKDYILKVPVGSIIKINKLLVDITTNSKRKRDSREPNKYEQKMFNYKKMEKLRRKALEGTSAVKEGEGGENAGNNDDEQPIIPSTMLDRDAENSFENDNDILSATLVQNASSKDLDDDEEFNNEELKEIASEKYKIYKFSEPTSSAATIKHTQNSIVAPPVFDLNQEGVKILIARGGKGGRGNTRFKSNENKAPHVAEAGQKGEQLEIEITLKMVANVGLIGLPNAGKSTLLSKLTAATPKIANYPFTTLEPNLGVAYIEGKPIILADIPGLIEGASAGRGLGFKFLRHTERTEILLHIIGLPERDQFSIPEELVAIVREAYTTVREELLRYGQSLPDKQEIIVINKIDCLREEERPEYIKPLEEELKKLDKPYAFISANEDLGLNGLKVLINKEVQDGRKESTIEQDTIK
jgi:GTP-binding protein